jgi:hypothetical protein
MSRARRLAGRCLLTALVLCGCSGEFATTRARLASAERAHDATRLRESLERIVQWHHRHATGLDRHLAPGASEAGVAEALAAIGCTPTDEMEILWQWHDGQSGPVPLVSYHDLLSLDDAVSEHRWLGLNPLVRWDPRYVPLLGFQDEWFAAYCDGTARTAGPVVHFFLEDGPRITHVNLTTFMSGVARAMHEGAISWSDGGMVVDEQALYRIHQELNPGYPYPYHVPATRPGG